jgi:hypothetical protein
METLKRTFEKNAEVNGDIGHQNTAKVMKMNATL